MLSAIPSQMAIWHTKGKRQEKIISGFLIAIENKAVLVGMHPQSMTAVNMRRHFFATVED
jgi:hypothetical protein